MSLKIKEAFKDKVIGFNRSSVPLGRRNDLHILYDIAKRSNRQAWLDMFEEVTEAEVEEVKVQAFEEKQKQKQQAPKPETEK